MSWKPAGSHGSPWPAKGAAAEIERHEAAQEVLAFWADPEPVTGHSRRRLSRL